MTPDIKPMQLGDIFDKTFTLFGKTFTRNARIVAVLFIPSFLLIFLAGAMVAALVANGVDTKDVSSIVGICLFSFIALACLIVSLVAGEIAVTRVVSGEILGEHYTWREGLEAARSIWLGRAIGAMFLRGIAVMGFIIISGVVIAVAISLQVTFAILIGVVLMFAAFAVAIRFEVLWIMTTPSIVCEDLGVVHSLARSGDLVKGSWWRIFGIILLLGLLLSFATSIITLPIGFASRIAGIRRFYDAQSPNAAPLITQSLNPADLPGILMSSGLVVLIQAFLNLLLNPLYTTVLYFDLRARHGDFLPAMESTTDIERFQRAGHPFAPESDLTRFQPPGSQSGAPDDLARFMPPDSETDVSRFQPPSAAPSVEPPQSAQPLPESDDRFKPPAGPDPHGEPIQPDTPNTTD
jgi:hypothetical protein